MNYAGLQMDADSSSLKLFKQGSGTINTSAGTSANVSATIAHGYGDDKLLWQVAIKNGQTNVVYTTPMLSNNGAYKLTSTLDSTNLTITVWFSVGVANPAITWTYNYRILIP